MNTRRKFLVGLGVAAGAYLAADEGTGAARRQFRRRSLRDCDSDNAEPGSRDRVIQPDYAKWKQIQLDMTEARIESLLGPPLEKDPSSHPSMMHLPPSVYRYSWTYGEIVFDSPVMPSGYYFRVTFNQGKVVRTLDPFDAQFSNDGRPTAPQLVAPHDGGIFQHYPRFVDLRWHPSSGEYPMKYVIEADFLNAGRQYKLFDSIETVVPHSTISFVGSQPGRWRVKAKNRLGVSDWSPYRCFDFSIETEKALELLYPKEE